MNLRKITLALTIGIFTCMEEINRRQQQQTRLQELLQKLEQQRQQITTKQEAGPQQKKTNKKKGENLIQQSTGLNKKIIKGREKNQQIQIQQIQQIKQKEQQQPQTKEEKYKKKLEEKINKLLEKIHTKLDDIEKKLTERKIKYEQSQYEKLLAGRNDLESMSLLLELKKIVDLKIKRMNHIKETLIDLEDSIIYRKKIDDQKELIECIKYHKNVSCMHEQTMLDVEIRYLETLLKELQFKEKEDDYKKQFLKTYYLTFVLEDSSRLKKFNPVNQDLMIEKMKKSIDEKIKRLQRRFQDLEPRLKKYTKEIINVMIETKELSELLGPFGIYIDTMLGLTLKQVLSLQEFALKMLENNPDIFHEWTKIIASSCRDEIDIFIYAISCETPGKEITYNQFLKGKNTLLERRKREDNSLKPSTNFFDIRETHKVISVANELRSAWIKEMPKKLQNAINYAYSRIGSRLGKIEKIEETSMETINIIFGIFLQNIGLLKSKTSIEEIEKSLKENESVKLIIKEYNEMINNNTIELRKVEGQKENIEIIFSDENNKRREILKRTIFSGLS